jgi:hypothetical protein
MKLISEQEWLEAMQEQDFEMPPLAGPSLFQKVTEGILIYLAVALIFHLINPL